MKTFTLFAVLLAASVAVGQTYKYTAPVVPAKYDVTTMTTSVNAWKYFPGTPVCAPQTLEFGKLDDSVSCMGANNDNPYRYDRPTKSWIRQSAMGTSPAQLAVVNWDHANLPANVYALIRTTACNAYNGDGGLQFYGVFHWSGSQWVQPDTAACLAGISVDYKGNLYAVGWDGPNNISALYQSTNGGTSWAFWSDSWKFINMTDDQKGCAITNANSIWEVFTAGSPSSFPALPSGTAAGCTVAENPFALMAWNTAGQAYVWLIGSTAWQAVAGINLQRAEGFSGYYIFGEDSSGKPYHWNVNAPGMISTFGGQWTTAQGCPTPGTPCNNPTTHTLHHSLQFNTCHGIHGCQESTSTQLWSANFSLPHSDYNPQCDPFLGGGVDDPECHATESAYGHCNSSGATLDPTGTTNYVVDDSVDVTEYTTPLNSSGPMGVTTGQYAGYYLAEVQNNVTGSCAPGDPVPACPAGPIAYIDIKATWWGNSAQQTDAYRRSLNLMGEDINGLTSPYVYHSFYMAQQASDGHLFNIICFPSQPDHPDDFLNGNIDAAPACK